MRNNEAQLVEIIDNLAGQYLAGMGAAAEEAATGGSMHYRYGQVYEAIPGSAEEEFLTAITLAALKKVHQQLMQPGSGVMVRFEIIPEGADREDVTSTFVPQSYSAIMNATWALDEQRSSP